MRTNPFGIFHRPSRADQDGSLTHALGFHAFLVLFFAVHRMVTARFLGLPTLPNPGAALAALATGFLGDVWIAAVLALAFFLLTAAWRPAWRGRAFLAAAGALVVLLGMHQSYVEFFGYQMLPFHFSYFTDPLFISANGPGLFQNPRVIATWAAGVVMAGLAWRENPWRRLGRRAQAWSFVGLILASVAAHSANIHWRVQLMLPENLRMNVAERLYEALTEKVLPDPLSPREWDFLAHALDRPVPHPAPAQEKAALTALLMNPLPPTTALPPAVQALRDAWRARVAAGARPLMLVILMESLRAADVGHWSRDGKPSLTPRLDALAADGVVFRAAFSTGNVTRGGQEAVWCGYLSSQNTSMMRKHPNLAVDCLPRLAARAAGQPGLAFWHHGGQGAFDGQRVFWGGQGVLNFLEEQSFAADAARTGWGVGDATFFRRAGEEWANLRAAHPAPFAVGMALSVSNHPPWSLPTDRDEETARMAATLPHPSYATVRYSDAALGAYVQDLQARGLWRDALVVITGDHGHQESPGYHADVEEKRDVRSAWLTHVPLVVTGGLVDVLRENAGAWATEKQHDETVSQADVAPFLAAILAPDPRPGEAAAADAPRFYGTPLWARRTQPVVANLGDRIYFPGLSHTYGQKEFLDAPVLQDDGEVSKSLLYYRAFLRLISF